MAAQGVTAKHYATQVGMLWSGLARTLTRLEEIAADPTALEADDTGAVLRRLQYRLHVASEEAFGLAPPTGVEPVHAELAEALAGARDATAGISDALDVEGPEAALRSLHEWRGALFRVRLARLRLTAPVTPPPMPEPAPAEDRRRAALAACLLVLFGMAALTAGAVAGEWPVWAAGMLSVGGSFIVYKP